MEEAPDVKAKLPPSEPELAPPATVVVEPATDEEPGLIVTAPAVPELAVPVVKIVLPVLPLLVEEPEVKRTDPVPPVVIV